MRRKSDHVRAHRTEHRRAVLEWLLLDTKGADMRARCSLYCVAVAAWTTWERSWSEVREFLAQIEWIAGEDAYPIDIIDSVIAVGAD